MDYLANGLELIFIGLTFGPILIGIIIGLIKKNWRWGVISSVLLLCIAWGIVALLPTLHILGVI